MPQLRLRLLLTVPQLSLSINSIKVFGERHSGTNAIGYFAGKNFNLKFQHYDFLGWKHRLAPQKAEWLKYDVHSCLFIFCLRNPYSWLQSMHKEPYYDHYPKIKELSFNEFIQFSIEDYENCIAMWNQKNKSYLRMAKEVPNAIIIRVEDFHSSQPNFHTKVASLLDKKETPFIPMNDYVNGRGWHKQNNISASLEIPKLNTQLIEVINSSLSMEIMKKCNYTLLK